MKQTYKISGMTCQSCRTEVENVLNHFPEVTSANVSLQNQEATIYSKNTIPLDFLQKALSHKYKITAQSRQSTTTPITPKKSKLQQLKPLLIIFGYLTVSCLLLNYKSGTWQTFMLDFMGLFFIVFSFFKILDYKGFPKSFAMYDPLAKVFPLYGWAYPIIETGLGILLLLRIQLPIALILTLIVLGITTIGVSKTLLNKTDLQCACLGTALKLPMTEATFIENTIMVIMSLSMLAQYF